MAKRPHSSGVDNAHAETGDGVVVSRFGSEILFETESGITHRGKVRRKLADIVCGDFVRYEKIGSDYAITKILKRKNTLVRQYFRGTPRNIAANIDQVIVVIAPAPATDWQMLDNLLVSIHRLPAEALIVFNKTDLVDKNSGTLNEFKSLGYTIIKTNKDSGLAELKKHLKNKTSIFIGQSGVGKTTLTNILIPEINAPTKALSESSDHGQHTTSNSIMYQLPEGGKIIDSPGIRDFTPLPLEKALYQSGFIEFEPFMNQCRFHNCLHRNEPNCAIKQAVENKEISQRRYQSYLALTE